jgi:hypothetical protein
MSENSEYEAPSVELVEAADNPAVTAAGPAPSDLAN